MLALSWIEIKHKRRYCQWKNLLIYVHEIYKRKLKKKKTVNLLVRKMSKTIQENKLTVMIKRLFYENSIYIRNLWAQTKIMTKTNSPSLPFDSSFPFVNCCKTAKPMTLKFLDFQFVFINFFWKIRCNCMSGLVVRPIYWR